MATEVPSVRSRLHTINAREIIGDDGVMLLSGSMRAEDRLAARILATRH